MDNESISRMSLDDLNHLIEWGELDAETMNLALTRLVELTFIQTCTDIDFLNDLISRDNWETSISEAALQRVVELTTGLTAYPNQYAIGENVMFGGEQPLSPIGGNGRKRPRSDDGDDDEVEASEDVSSETAEGADPASLSSPGSNPGFYYEIEKIKERNVKKFKAKALDYRLRLKNMEDLPAMDSILLVSTIFEDVLDRVGDGIADNDMVRVVLQATGLDKPISLPFMRNDHLTVDRFMTRIEHVLQSHEELKVGEDWDLSFVHLRMPVGGKTGRKAFMKWEEKKKSMRCLVRITEPIDSLCCARAIVTGIAKHEMSATSNSWSNIRKGRKEQGVRARALHQKAGIPEGPCGLKEIEAFQKVIEDYQICVVSKDQFNKIVYTGPLKPKGIYLLYNDNHYDLITSMAAYLRRGYWCHECKQGYDVKSRHMCEKTCRLCHHGGCRMGRDIDTWKYCEDCNRYFKDATCYANHKRVRSEKGEWKTVCQQYYKCSTCQQFINRRLYKGYEHKCGESFCGICKKFCPIGHKCYIQPVNDDLKKKKGETNDEKADPDKLKYIFFDFECTQDEGLHEPNLCVVQKVCEECADQEFEEPCAVCGEEKQRVFRGEGCRDNFCTWLFENEENKHSICIAHNLKGYDSYFILQFLYDNVILPEVIMNGGKVMSLHVKECDIKFIDSLNYFTMPLSKLPKAFGIQECKGHFPHLFNKKANQDYIGDLPAVEYFDPDGMSETDRAAFLEWYQQEEGKGEPYIFQEQILKYCVMDVDILRKCCLKFRQLFMKVSIKKEGGKDKGVDPFKSCITIASACNLVLRRNFLQPETIAIIPPLGYTSNQNHSLESLRWLSYVALRDGVHIQHAMNGGEQRVGNYFLDGFCPEVRRIYEYQSCFHHGCPDCYDPDTINPVSGEAMAELYRRTLEKIDNLKKCCPGHEIVEMWSHEWIQTWKDLPPNLKEKLKVPAHVEPLRPRESLYGGRTECTKLLHHCEDGERIKYLDFCSLYPATLKFGEYVVGHPKIFTNSFQDVSSYFGLIRCSVIAPKRLFHPVLPMRCHGKLMFTLCRTCMENRQKSDCYHTDQERMLRGTWVTLEVQKAVEMGYRVENIEVVWHWEEKTQFDPATKSGGLFTDYINTFLRLKQEASGWPEWCQTTQDKEKYVREYLENEGILLDPTRVEKNSGLRALAKLCLNSMWGKLSSSMLIIFTYKSF